MKDLIEFLSLQWGKPDVAAPHPPAGGGALAGKQGAAYRTDRANFWSLP